MFFSSVDIFLLKLTIVLRKSKSISKLKGFLFVSLVLLFSSYVSYAQNINKSEQVSEILTIEVQNLSNQTTKEKETVKGAIERLDADSLYREIYVKDGSKIVVFSKNSKGKRNISISNNISSIRSKLPSTSQEKIITYIPAYPGCQGLAVDERIACNSVQTAELVNKRYDFDFDAIKFLLVKD